MNGLPDTDAAGGYDCPAIGSAPFPHLGRQTQALRPVRRSVPRRKDLVGVVGERQRLSCSLYSSSGADSALIPEAPFALTKARRLPETVRASLPLQTTQFHQRASRARANLQPTSAMDPPQEEASRTAAREKKKRQRDSLSPEEARVKRQKNTEAKRKARGAIGEHNDITSQEFQTTERRYQQMCRDAEMLYLAPITGRTNVELKAHTRKRRSNMTKMCDLYSDVNSEKFKATEDEYRKKCADAGVPYMAPDIDRDATIEDKRHTTRRRTAMTRSYTQRNDI
ncbi:hypothetical protein THAOC_11669, partial [Thalassiosira oceanica]